MARQLVERDVYNFIRRHFTLEDFNRAKFEEIPFFMRFEIYPEFLAEQQRIIQAVTIPQLERYRIAIADVQAGMIQSVDKDGMDIRDVTGFFLNEGRIVYSYRS